MKLWEGGKGFTLIELLIVVGILAVLITIVVIVINPAELFKQARDSQRVVDAGSLQKAIELLFTQNTEAEHGNISTVYISIPDPLLAQGSTSTCDSLGLPNLPSGYQYHCVAEPDLYNTDGSGWVPINFQDTDIQRMSHLPVDPINETSTLSYYTYMRGSWNITAPIESEKLRNKSYEDKGYDSERHERGSNFALWNDVYNIMEYWDFDASYSGSVTSRVTSHGGVLQNGAQISSTDCKRKKCLQLDGSNDYVSIADNITPQDIEELTVMLWFRADAWNGFPTGYANFFDRYYIPGSADKLMLKKSGTQYGGDRKLKFYMTLGLSNYVVSSNSIVTDTNWHHLAGAWDGDSMRMYLDGDVQSHIVTTAEPVYTSNRPVNIGRADDSTEYFDGLIDDVRFYNRVLSANEIENIYEKTK